MKKTFDAMKKEDDRKLHRIVSLETNTNKLVADVTFIKDRKRSELEKVFGELNELKDKLNKKHMDAKFDILKKEITEVAAEQNFNNASFITELSTLKDPFNFEVGRLRKENETIMRELERMQAQYRDLLKEFLRTRSAAEAASQPDLGTHASCKSRQA